MISRRSLLRGGVATLVAAPSIARADSAWDFIFPISSANASVLAQSGGPLPQMIHNLNLAQFGVTSGTIPLRSNQLFIDFVVAIKEWNTSANPEYVLFGAHDIKGYLVSELKLENGNGNFASLRLTIGDPRHITQSWSWPNAIPIGATNPDGSLLHTGGTVAVTIQQVNGAPTFETSLMLYNPELAMSNVVNLTNVVKPDPLTANAYSYINGIQPGIEVATIIGPPRRVSSLQQDPDLIGQGFPINWVATNDLSGSNLVVYYQGFKSHPVLVSSLPSGVGWALDNLGATYPGTSIIITKTEWNPNIPNSPITDSVSFIEAQIVSSENPTIAAAQSRLFNVPQNIFYPTGAYFGVPNSSFVGLGGNSGISPFLLSGNMGGGIPDTNITSLVPPTTPIYPNNNSAVLPQIFNPTDAQFSPPWRVDITRSPAVPIGGADPLIPIVNINEGPPAGYP